MLELFILNVYIPICPANAMEYSENINHITVIILMNECFKNRHAKGWLFV
jgi:hypothetical protein